MNDYFGRLVARSMNLAEVIQPRLASRFEPARANGALGSRAAVPLMMEEDIQSEPPVQAYIPPPQEQGSEPEALSANANNVKTSRGLVQQPQLKVKETSFLSSPQQEEGELKSEAFGEGPPLFPMPARAARLASLKAIPRPQSTQWPEDGAKTPNTVREEVRSPASDLKLQFTEPESQRSLQPIVQSIIEQSVVERRMEQPAIVREPKPFSNASNAIVVQPRVTLVDGREVERRRSENVHRLTQDPAPAPTIQVTIGRVEVRAALPITPTSKPRRTSQTMSLDQYLAQRRNRGGR